MVLQELRKSFTILLLRCCFKEETEPEVWKAMKKGQVSELGAVNVMTGIYTGRSPKGQIYCHG